MQGELPVKLFTTHGSVSRGQGNPWVKHTGQIRRSDCELSSQDLPRLPVYIHSVLSLHHSPYLRHDHFWVCASTIYDAFRLPNTICLAMKENSFVLLPPCVGNCIFDERSCWSSSHFWLRT